MTEQIVPPAAVQAYRESITCPRCGSGRAPAGKVIVLLSQRALGIWLLVGKCFDCDLTGFWQLISVEDDEQPVRERTGEDVPLPDAFKGLLS